MDNVNMMNGNKPERRENKMTSWKQADLQRLGLEKEAREKIGEGEGEKRIKRKT